MVSTWNVSYPIEPAGFWLNRAELYAFSFVWWESVMFDTPLGCRLDGLGVALGFSIHINFKPVVWNWSSNSYTMDFLIQDGYATVPGGGIFPGIQQVTIEAGADECDMFPLLRMRDTGVPNPMEHIFRFPVVSLVYWNPPLPAPYALPILQTYPRVSPC